jgi:hypothetical protein
MRTNIVIDDALMAEALRLSQLKTKKAVVERGLQLLIQLKNRKISGDVIIGTLCIVENLLLLHDDRDSEPMVEYISLKVIPKSFHY